MQTLFDVIRRVEEFLISFGILTIAFLTASNVVTRTLLGQSLAFAEEISQFLIIMVTFVGTSYAAGQGRHIRMTAIYDQMSLAWKRRMMIFSSALTAFLMFLLTYYSILYVGTVKTLGSISPVLHVPLYLVYCSAPLGLALTGFQFTLTALRNAYEKEEIYLSFMVREELDTP